LGVGNVGTSGPGSNAGSLSAAVEKWIVAIKEEEVLASVNHTVAELDKSESAHFKEDEIRSKVTFAKKR
jgi:hypothetical protein